VGTSGPSRTLVGLYGAICRCESCAGLQDWDGVREFAERGARQTIPVSHFGRIHAAKVWLVCFNPANDRNDPNVGLTVSFLRDVLEDRVQAGDLPDFTCRADLPDGAVEEAVRHFSEYDFEFDGHEFFAPWRDALNGLTVGKDVVSFQNGGICVVDAIKCPTRLPIGGWFGREAKTVAANCGKSGNAFLLSQIAFHRPSIVIFAGTQNLVPAAVRGRPDQVLLKAADHPYISAVRSNSTPSPRLSVELRSARGIKRTTPTILFGALQRIITAWKPELPRT